MSNQVVVIEFDKHDNIDCIYLDSEENAIKAFLIHNLYELANYPTFSEYISFIEQCLKIIKKNKWQEDYCFWQTYEINVRELRRPIIFYHLDSPKKMPVEKFNNLLELMEGKIDE